MDNNSSVNNPLAKLASSTVERLLKIRLRSEAEIRWKLAEKKIPDDVIDDILKRYRQLKIVDDEFFAKQWIQSRLNRPFGWTRIIFELKQKGVSAEIIEQEIRRAHEEFDESACLLALAKRRAEKYQHLPEDKAKQRLIAFLQRRGFNPQTIYQTIKEL